MVDAEDIAARRELIRSLFALVTAKLEEAAGQAADGQVVMMAEEAVIDLAHRLHSTGQEIMVLADAIVCLAQNP